MQNEKDTNKELQDIFEKIKKCNEEIKRYLNTSSLMSEAKERSNSDKSKEKFFRDMLQNISNKMTAIIAERDEYIDEYSYEYGKFYGLTRDMSLDTIIKQIEQIDTKIINLCRDRFDILLSRPDKDFFCSYRNLYANWECSVYSELKDLQIALKAAEGYDCGLLDTLRKIKQGEDR